jgi:hypothetical protein
VWYDTGNRGELSIHAVSDEILCGHTQLWFFVETFWSLEKNNEELIVTGILDATYASDLDSQQSVMG